MFSQVKLSGKILGVVAGALLVTSALSYWVTQRRINNQAEEAFRDKVRQITGMASTTRAWFSDNLDVMVPDHNFHDIKQAPVVVAWSVAERYAEDNHMTFRTPSLRPRNPKNAPNEFERRALELFQKDAAVKEYSDRAQVDGKEVMRYAQPVRITPDCLRCHGDPVGERDPFGYAKEGMRVGDLRGAFVITASAEPLVHTANANSLALLLLSLFTLVASAGAVYVVMRRVVVQPLTKSVALANSIAEHDLTADDLDESGHDEIAETNVALNKMKNNLRAMVNSISCTAESVAAAAEELSATATEQSEASERQRSQVLHIVTAMHEMTSTVVEVSGNSNHAAEVARESAIMAHEGGDIVANTLGTMQVISDAVASTGKRVDELGKRSNEIGRIAAVIDEIADQTNLLALNAAIEAARAGEQGRGFAVVADEVRKLAERTTTATKEIARMIEAIQGETRSAVAAMEGGTKQVKDGVEATKKAGDALHQLIAKAEEVGDMITTIATAATEQSSATEEVKTSVEQISRLVESSTIGTQQAAKACHDLSELTHGLHKLIEQFKLEHPGNAPHNRLPLVPAGHEDESSPLQHFEAPGTKRWVQ